RGTLIAVEMAVQFTPGLRDRGAGPHKELPAMEFRWVAAIALWTILSGPVFAPPAPSRARGVTAASVRKATVQKPASPERNLSRPAPRCRPGVGASPRESAPRRRKK